MNMKYSVQIGQKISDPFGVNKILRQGWCISTTVFEIYVAKALM